MTYGTSNGHVTDEGRCSKGALQEAVRSAILATAWLVGIYLRATVVVRLWQTPFSW